MSAQTAYATIREQEPQLERGLEDLRNLRQKLVGESRDAIVILNENGGVYDANPCFGRLLGYSMDEIYTLSVWDWDASMDKAQIKTLLKDIDQTGQRFETVHRRKDGTLLDIEMSNNGTAYRGKKFIFCICRDITERKKAEKERENIIATLKASLAEIKTMEGMLPLCSFCKKVRNDNGDWEQVDSYIEQHSGVDVTHSICPECLKKNYPEEYEYIQLQKNK